MVRVLQAREIVITSVKIRTQMIIHGREFFCFALQIIESDNAVPQPNKKTVKAYLPKAHLTKPKRTAIVVGSSLLRFVP